MFVDISCLYYTYSYLCIYFGRVVSRMLTLEVTLCRVVVYLLTYFVSYTFVTYIFISLSDYIRCYHIFGIYKIHICPYIFIRIFSNS